MSTLLAAKRHVEPWWCQPWASTGRAIGVARKTTRCSGPVDWLEMGGYPPQNQHIPRWEVQKIIHSKVLGWDMWVSLEWGSGRGPKLRSWFAFHIHQILENLTGRSISKLKWMNGLKVFWLVKKRRTWMKERMHLMINTDGCVFLWFPRCKMYTNIHKLGG